MGTLISLQRKLESNNKSLIYRWATVYIELFTKIGPDEAQLYANANIPPQFGEQVAKLVQEKLQEEE